MIVSRGIYLGSLMIDDYAVGVRHVVDSEWLSKSHWDYFVSAYNDSERVKSVFDMVSAEKKLFVILEEYNYSDDELGDIPKSEILRVRGCGSDESEVASQIINELNIPEKAKVCIDMTGFMRPHIFSIFDLFSGLGVDFVDFIYAEPSMYEKKENTTFSSGDVLAVRQISGFHGIHEDDDAEEVLIVGVGYDNQLISRVINDKESAKVFKIISFPSLSPDMYQQGLLCLERCSLSDDDRDNSQSVFSPANDAFSVASEASRLYRGLKEKGKLQNFYLCSLSTKPQSLGFAIFYHYELRDEPCSVIFPYSQYYKRETSAGIGNIWRYRVEF